MKHLQRLPNNAGLKLLSLCLATVLWLFVNYDRETERELMVPVRLVNLPPGLEIAGEAPSRLSLVVTGRRIQVLWFDPDEAAVTLDLKNLGEGPVRFLELQKAVHLGPDLRVTRLSPGEVQLKLVKKR